MKGMYDNLVRPILVVFGILTLSSIAGAEIDAAIFKWSGYGADSTDTEDHRSGMALFTDAGTGCQYLASPWGGITPRMGASGKHVCPEADE